MTQDDASGSLDYPQTMGNPSLKEMLEIATDAAYLGGKRTLAYFNSGVAVEQKSDSTPVTRADREAEQVIREHITRCYPDHQIVGEEHGATDGDPDYRWIVDPLDGTKSFIHGVPLYGTLIGVEVKGVASVGAVYMPALGETIAAATGLGCIWNGRPARVSTINRLEDATISTTSFGSCVKRSDAYEKLAAKTKLQRGWGDVYGYVLVATGRIEVMLDSAMNLWDAAPLLPILEEAGGHFTDWKGTPTISGNEGCATNAALHAHVVEILRAERRRSS
jgi:histidinol-phosphatase